MLFAALFLRALDSSCFYSWANQASSGRTDNKVHALQLAFGHLRLQVEQAQELVGELRREMPDIVSVLAMVLPHMSSPLHAHVLVAMYLKDDPLERRRLESDLGPAFRPIMGLFTDHYRLDLSKQGHRLALLKVAELNNLESRFNRFHSGRKDTSQKGNWNNYRNEMLNGKPFELSEQFFDPLPTVRGTHAERRTAGSPKGEGGGVAAAGEALRLLGNRGGEAIVPARCWRRDRDTKRAQHQLERSELKTDRKSVV